MKQLRLSRKNAIAVWAVAGLILFSGCGSNDNPMPELTVRAQWPAAAGGYTQMMVDPADTDFPVVTFLVGAVIITHTDVPYLDGGLVTTEMKKLIQDDALRSAKYFAVAQMSSELDSISFQMPPPSVSNKWQLFAVGLQYHGETLSDITNMPANAPTWLAFDSRGFMGGLIKPDEVVTITMKRACAISYHEKKPACVAAANPAP
ncbi:MAG: hypothetical protein OEW39_01240 [Deltaproteobacteria bacterium]|nr:hypothetical protein [Deltaproteobacteria bacterium]